MDSTDLQPPAPPGPPRSPEGVVVPERLPRGIEANGINPIVEGQRTGRARGLFWPWFASNVSVFGISYGAFVLFDGLSLWQAVVAGVAGIVASFLLVGIVAVAGPRGSAPTMVVSRAAFGVRGNRVAALLSWVLTVGWEVFLVVVGTLAIASVCGRLGLGSGVAVKIAGIAVIAGLTIIGGVTGFQVIMRMQGAITIIAGLLSVVVMALTASHVRWSVVSALPGGSTAAFIGAVVLAATGFGLGWVYAGADYSRYLPRRTSPRSIVAWTTFGGSVAPAVLLSYGVLLAGSSKPLLNGIADDPIGALSGALPHWFLVPFIVLTVLGLVGGTVMDVYSSGLNLQSAGLRLPRHLAALVDGTLMTLGSVYVVFFAHSSFLSQFEGFLITLGVPVGAWAGVFIADTLLRRRDFAELDLYSPAGRYGDVRAWPLALIVVGSAVGFGMVTGAAGVGWLRWQGYLLGPLGLGGRHGVWSGADLGVVAAILIGLVGTLSQRGRIRREEALPAAVDRNAGTVRSMRSRSTVRLRPIEPPAADPPRAAEPPRVSARPRRGARRPPPARGLRTVSNLPGRAKLVLAVALLALVGFVVWVTVRLLAVDGRALAIVLIALSYLGAIVIGAALVTLTRLAFSLHALPYLLGRGARRLLARLLTGRH